MKIKIHCDFKVHFTVNSMLKKTTLCPYKDIFGSLMRRSKHGDKGGWEDPALREGYFTDWPSRPWAPISPSCPVVVVQWGMGYHRHVHVHEAWPHTKVTWVTHWCPSSHPQCLQPFTTRNEALKRPLMKRALTFLSQQNNIFTPVSWFRCSQCLVTGCFLDLKP